MANIDNMRGDTLRVVEENTLDNMRGVTQRVISENSIDNTRGVTYRVYNVNGGSTPVIDELNVTPSTSAQTITAPSGVDGYSPVNVSAVTSAIDANIVAGNIKKDVEILGVTGSYEGQTPTGTKSITANGVYDVTDFASADVNVPSTAPAHYIEKTVDADGKLVNSTNIINVSGATKLGKYALAYQYSELTFPANTTADFSSITSIDKDRSCLGIFIDSSIQNIDFGGLTTISGYNVFETAFSNGNVSSVDFSGLTTISGGSVFLSAFSYQTGIQSIDFSSLTTISGTSVFNKTFNACSSIQSVKMNALNVITKPLCTTSNQMFYGATNLSSVEFGGLTASTFASIKNQLQYICNQHTGSAAPNGCTIHFPSNFDPSDPNHTFDASTLTGYPTFGGIASFIHVAFDLPATE